jgi:single-stranded-DNA-specific exonuclease
MHSDFLNPDYDRDMLDPFLMRDMDKSISRIKEAIEKNQKIVIYADYDCDGIPGAVILSDLFKKLKYENYEVYIPERNSEGYGLNFEAIEDFRTRGVNLIITIDLGITAIEEVTLANSYNIEVIITDHHLPRTTLGEKGIESLDLPQAYGILNPKVDEYPEKMLCGSGVVFKLVEGFLKRYGGEYGINLGWEKWLLDMAGLATLSDMVPLTGENRTIAYYGMKVLRKSPRPGLQKLLAKMNIDQKYLSTGDVTFMITPRINAASRMDSPMRAFELLATKDETEGGTLANHLTKINDERKNIVLHIMKEVKKHFEKREELKDLPVLVIGNPLWRVGVLGIVAGKVMEEYDKPVFIWGKDENDIIKGSCRSPGSVSVVELMTHAKEYFAEYGGHELAGGFSVKSEQIHFLEEGLNKSFQEIKKSDTENENKISYDLKLSFGDVNLKNNTLLEKMEPFGLANPTPVFLFENVKIENIKKFGKNGSGEHLEITFSDSTRRGVVAISFFSNTESFNTKIEVGLSVNLIASFDLSRFRGRPELRLRIVDIC